MLVQTRETGYDQTGRDIRHPEEPPIEPRQQATDLPTSDLQAVDLPAIDQVVPHPKMRPVLAHWRALSQQQGGLPARNQLDACAFIGCLGDVMLLKVIGAGADYRYDLIGENIRDLFGVSYLRRTLQQVAFHGYETLLTEYRSVVASRRPFYIERRQISERLFMEIVVGKLILPLGPAGDQAAHTTTAVGDLLICLAAIG